jgi:hypothetical protein
MSKGIAPGEVEVLGYFSKHLGPRYISAGLRIPFHYNQIPGVHFKTAISEEYREAVLKGLGEAMSVRFPDFPETGSIWITEVIEDPIASSWLAFYLAARGIVDLAYALQQSGSLPSRAKTEN